MDPVVRNLFDDIIKRIEDFRSEYEASSARLERRIADSDEARQEHDAAVAARLESLEQAASAQYTAAVVADNWGGHFNDRVSDLEQRVLDIELVRYGEIQDERDDRVAALESAVAALEDWRPRVEKSIVDSRAVVSSLSRRLDRFASDTAPSPPPAAGDSPAGNTANWPVGHGESTTTRDTGHGVVTTLNPFPANVSGFLSRCAAASA